MLKETQTIAKSTKTTRFPQHGPAAENGKEILLSLKHVDINFGKGEKLVRAVQDVSLDIYKGETFSLVGESGSGKTTIGRAIIRANTCAGGGIYYKGVRISGRISRSLDRDVIRNIQMVFQDPATSLNERATVEQIVSEGLTNFRLYKNKAERAQKVEKMIEDVGLLQEHMTRYPHEFSGGQRQRVGLARAMVMEPELVVADEPISALDVSIRAHILNLMNKFKRERNTTCLFIAHDLSVVRYFSDRIGVIYKGRIMEIAPAEELYNYPLHPYTRSLISAIPLPDPQLERNKVLFTYEAPEANDGSDEEPKLTLVGHDHYVYGREEEIEEFRKIRDRGVPLKPISVKGVNAEAPADGEKSAPVPAREVILDRPIHDTGSALYVILSFLLPLLGLPAAYIFKKHNFIRNFKACRKGAIASFIFIGVMLLVFAFLIFMAIR